MWESTVLLEGTSSSERGDEDEGEGRGTVRCGVPFFLSTFFRCCGGGGGGGRGGRHEHKPRNPLNAISNKKVGPANGYSKRETGTYYQVQRAVYTVGVTSTSTGTGMRKRKIGGWGRVERKKGDDLFLASRRRCCLSIACMQNFPGSQFPSKFGGPCSLPAYTSTVYYLLLCIVEGPIPD